MQLTKREREVLEIAATGMLSAEIGARLCVSKRTIDFHLAGVREKFRVRTTQAAYIAAVREGQVHCPCQLMEEGK